MVHARSLPRLLKQERGRSTRGTDAYGSIVIENSRPTIGTRTIQPLAERVPEKNPSPKPCTNSRIVAYDGETRKAPALAACFRLCRHVHLAIASDDWHSGNFRETRTKGEGKKNEISWEKYPLTRVFRGSFYNRRGLGIHFVFFSFFLLPFSYASRRYRGMRR